MPFLHNMVNSGHFQMSILVHPDKNPDDPERAQRSFEGYKKIICVLFICYSFICYNHGFFGSSISLSSEKVS